MLIGNSCLIDVYGLASYYPIWPSSPRDNLEITAGEQGCTLSELVPAGELRAGGDAQAYVLWR